MLRELIDQIRADFPNVIAETDIRRVNEQLREIISREGLGVALLVAWQHGLEVGHIPTKVEGLPPDETKPVIERVKSGRGGSFEEFVFAHIPIRGLRRQTQLLIDRGIMNRNPDPVDFIYHEDGIIGDFSFPPDGASVATWIERTLAALASQGILVRANINNRQIQFKDVASKSRIEGSRKPLYVKGSKSILDEKGNIRREVWWPAVDSGQNSERLRNMIADAIERKQVKLQCNYCSVQALNPNEATIHVANAFGDPGTPNRATLTRVRNYQMGFTFAPFGPPDAVCHFLAWDFPHVNDVVNNMDPQSYSFGDLIKLVRVINENIAKYTAKNGIPGDSFISGACNHWAGNTIYHQHYQFFHIPDLPLATAPADGGPMADWRKASVRKLEWPAPAYLISAEPESDEDVVWLADRLAAVWDDLNPEGDYDSGFGNGIRIANHTQNTFVTVQGGRLRAVLIPRTRSRLSAAFRIGSREFRKNNAAVLEMMGYFLLDDRLELMGLKAMGTEQMCDVGSKWLRDLKPDEASIAAFEAEVKSLTTPMLSLSSIIQEMGKAESIQDAWDGACELVSRIRADSSLNDGQRARLLTELNECWVERWGGDAVVDDSGPHQLGAAKG